DPDRNTSLGCVEESKGLEIVKHLDGHLVTKSDVRIVNERLQSLLLQRAVDEGEASRNRIVKDHAADGRVDNATHIVLNRGAQDVLRVVFLDEVNQITLDTEFDWSLGCDFVRIKRE